MAKQEWPCWFYHPDKPAVLMADPAAADVLLKSEPGWLASVVGGDPDALAAAAPRVGPTIEEYVSAGYLPQNYPPDGYAEKPSPYLTFYRETGLWPSIGQAPVPPVPPALTEADKVPPPAETAKDAPPAGRRGRS